MLIKEKVKFKYSDNDGNTRYATVIVKGRNTTELNGRVEKLVNRKLHIGWELR